MSQNSDDNQDDIKKQIQQSVDELKLGKIDWDRPATPEEIQFLLNQWPFLQLVNTTPDLSTSYPLEFIQAKSGWIIYNYTNALSSSPGEGRFGFRQQTFPPEVGAGAGEFIPLEGTIVKQAFNTAEEMVLLAKEMGWGSINIFDGTELMKWSAWFFASENNIPVENFSPDAIDEIKRNRLKRSPDEIQKIIALRSGSSKG